MANSSQQTYAADYQRKQGGFKNILKRNKRSKKRKQGRC